MRNYNKRGSIGITIVMLVFCLLMSVSMSYHKTIQTESLIQNNVNYSDRAVDAAFSGVNYAMAVIQSNKKVFAANPVKVTFTTADKSENNYKSQWINLASAATFTTYLDDDRKEDQQKQHPPYRFKIACADSSYNSNVTKVIIKSYGEYIKYDENDIIVASYSAQLMAECIIATSTKTIKLNRYRKMTPQNPDPDANTTNPSFFSFSNYDNDK
ncbi:MAG: hypothetical protein IKO19_00470 [Candidatus Riflebacteria bacterium]|nr:hypothetical protein [Candidatus Riflebacteria bacterium]